MLRSIAIYPRLSCEPEIYCIRKQFDSLADIVPAHATIVFPFESCFSTCEIRLLMEAALHGFPPIYLSLDRPVAIGDTVQIPLIDGERELRLLHDRMYSGILQEFLKLDIPYHPHITIGRSLDMTAQQLCIRQAEPLVGSTGLVKEVACEIIGQDASSTIEITSPLHETNIA